MTPVLKVIPCLIVGAIVIRVHDNMAHTWAPMFRLILISLALSSLIGWWFFHRAHKATTRRRWTARHCLAVFVFFASWIFLWAAAEEALIAWTLAEYGQDDTGGRYFYPGHSGMGYADGFLFPMKLFWKIITLALPAAWLLGKPISMIGQSKGAEASS